MKTHWSGSQTVCCFISLLTGESGFLLRGNTDGKRPSWKRTDMWKKRDLNHGDHQVSNHDSLWMSAFRLISTDASFRCPFLLYPRLRSLCKVPPYCLLPSYSVSKWWCPDTSRVGGKRGRSPSHSVMYLIVGKQKARDLFQQTSNADSFSCWNLPSPTLIVVCHAACHIKRLQSCHMLILDEW